MATNSSVNNESYPFSTIPFTIDPGASGDSYIQYGLLGVDKFRIGADDDDSDALVLSSGSALGTNNIMRIDVNGNRFLPLTPAYLAYLATTATNVTGNGATYTFTGLTEVFDQNGDQGTSLFTAPVTGRYKLFVATTISGGTTASMVGLFVNYTTSNRNMFGFTATIGNVTVSDSWSYLADMDAADTATPKASLGGSALTADADGGASAITYVSGVLAC